jgi:hypothetical protein
VSCYHRGVEALRRTRPESAMSQGPATRIRAVLLLAAAVFVLAEPGRTEDLIVLRVDRRQPVALAPEVTASVTPLVELKTAWIVAAPAAAVQRLQRAGATFQVLETTARDRVLSLVRTGAGDPSLRLGGGVRAWAVEEGMWVVASATRLARDELPADASYSPLSGGLPVRLAFERVGATSAAPRQGAAEAAAPDSRIQALVGRVSSENLASIIQHLQAFQTRYCLTSSATAAAWAIHDRFRSYGLQVSTEEFVFDGVQQLNVVATIPGRVSPEQVVVVGAHYDSYSRQAASSSAPGADDNASGTAAVLELARVMAGQAFDFTVRFVTFGAEETGLNGSRHHATQARARGEQIVAMLNLDMIAYVDRAPEDLDATANPASTWLGDFYASTTAAYSTLPVTKWVNASFRSSDHAPFWDQGYPALLLIEDNSVGSTNPYYHSTEDRFEVLDMSFATAVAQATLAAAAALAQPASSPAPPSGVTARQLTGSSLFSNVATLVVEWRGSPDAVAGYNVYRASTSHGTYTRLNTAPVRGSSFVQNQVFRGTSRPTSMGYVVVTAVDAAGREGNRSLEVITP